MKHMNITDEWTRQTQSSGTYEYNGDEWIRETQSSETYEYN